MRPLIFRPILASLILAATSLVAAGPISPPAGSIGGSGPVSTRPQVEPRRPIPDPSVALSFPITLTEEGSYFLTQDIIGVSGQHGIVVAASQVTIDLNGFTIRGVPGSLEGISNGTSTTLDNITVKNGTISFWGQDGIDLVGSKYSRVENVSVVKNNLDGMRLGIRAMVRNVHANGNIGDGIEVEGDSRISESLAGDNGGHGFTIGSWSTIERCSALQNGGDGIVANDNATIRSNELHANSAGGVHTTGVNNRIESNHIVANARGLDLDSSGSYVADNTVRNNADNYSIAADNKLNILLGQVPESIDWPATVKLDGTLNAATGQDGIVITSSNVTIDLDGHSLNGVRGGSQGTGIEIGTNLARITIKNGAITNWRNDGIGGSAADIVHVENVLVDNVGNNGIFLRSFAIVRNCIVTNSTVDGIYAEGNCLIENNSVGNSGQNGIDIGFSSIVRHNAVRVSGTVSGPNGAGIEASADNYIHDNTLDDHGSTNNKGIRLLGEHNRVQGNNITAAYYAVYTEDDFNLIIRNSVSDIPNFGVAFFFINNSGATASLGPIRDASTISGNTSPEANFVF